jgi:DNA invertase Pin-like site-specific DNA recombinase
MSLVYGYGRHSTEKQSLSEDAQRQRVDGYWAAHLPDASFGGWFYDSAVSGKSELFEREQGRMLLALAQPGDHIVVAKLDRAFRNTIDGLRSMELLYHKGVFFHCIDAKLDTGSAQGRAIATVMLAFAQLDREQTSERTRDALAVKRKAGLPYNSGVPIGWKKVGSRQKSRWVPDEVERDQCYMITGFRAAGYSLERIVSEMRRQVRPNGHRWNRNSVGYALRAAEKRFPKALPRARPRVSIGTARSSH